MKRSILFAISLLVLMMWLLLPDKSPSASGQTNGADDRFYDTLLIGIQPQATAQALADQLASYGLVVVREWPRFHLVEARPLAVSAAGAAETSRSAAAHAALAASPLVRYVDYDGAVTIAGSAVPNDPQYAGQWAFPAISTLAGWDISVGNPQIAVAVLDTGVDMTHEDLPVSHLWRNSAESAGLSGVDDDGNGFIDDVHGWDWYGNDSEPQDQHGHGTHVSGVIVAATNNGVGVAGHGGSIKVAALRVLGPRGSGSVSDLVAGLDYALEMGFDVVNLSLTVSFDSPALGDAIQTAADQGVIVVTAAGNQNSSVLWPAAYPGSLAVAATAEDGGKAAFSNYGPAIDLAAPGAKILSTVPVGSCPSCTATGYREMDGTSMATPHVSALAALVWSLRPDLNRAQVIEIMTSTADDLNAAVYPGEDDQLGAGEIDFAAALAKASDELTIVRDQAAAAIAAPGAEVPYPLQVLAPTGLPVAGAVVQAQITDKSFVSLGESQRSTTDIYGMAEFSVSTPVTPGSFLVRASVGDTVSFMPLEVLTSPVTVSLTVGRNSAVAGGPAIPFTVTVDANGAITSGLSLPLLLATNLGTFANRSSTASFDMSGLEFSGEYFPGVVAGQALIQASVGGFPASATVSVEPDAAATISGQVISVTHYSGGDRYLLSFDLSDAYGNLPAPTQVVFTADQGTLFPAQGLSAGGQLSTTLDLPTAAYGTASVTATVTPVVSATVTIDLTERYFLPSLFGAGASTQ